ncbi:respiratory nitrate reductase subunit gamma [bacterium]|nr:respiratory nitrate reductase subunit gamma [bacterium]
MDALIEFTTGPLFRLAFAICLFGLVRVLLLSVSDIYMMLRRAGERNVPWGDLFRTTVSWFVPVKHIPKHRTMYSLVSILFHAGLILVPLFYSSHVILWDKNTGLSWGFWMPQTLAHILTLTTIGGGIYLLLARALNDASRHISRGPDYFFVSLLLVPFITGIFMTNVVLAANVYQWMMMLHALSAVLILVLIPFTKIAHVALFPLGRYIAAAAWKFPKGAGDKVMATLGREKMREEIPA